MENNMHRILAIEDDPLMRRLLRDTFKPAGFDFLSCDTGLGGLRSAEDDKPDLIILDFNLPDIDGLEVCRRLKAGAATRHIPVVILTGEARGVAQRVSALDSGADDYLFKPISPRALTSRVRALLRPANG
ncbi:MAG: hypothetical protein A2X36_15050 [Elusimicrobia bacterium GWA2_69_24]|nr:MAG: hypothetical protein A2X36_15050 [Elusimicrobia bacterium GWA2_69_24]